MSLHEINKKIKAFIIILLILNSYLFARFITSKEVKYPVYSVKKAEKREENSNTLKVFGSRSGTRYYYPWCRGGDRVKEDNKIWFSGKDEAIKYGLTKASNCLGP